MIVGADRPPAGAPPNLPPTSLACEDRVRCVKGTHKGKTGKIVNVKGDKVKVEFDPIPPSTTREVSVLQKAENFRKVD